MPAFAETVAKIHSPFPTILDFLEQLNRQVKLGTVAVDGEGSVYGTLTARRANFKPFIIGIIPPDVPVNFVPVEQAPGRAVFSQGNGIVQVKANWSTGPGGKVPRKSQSFKAEELRKEIFKAYVKFTGQIPPERTLALIYAQIKCETGKDPHSPMLSAPNFNLGSSHVTYNSGQKVGRLIDDDEKRAEIDPKHPFVPPSDDFRYFVAIDHDQATSAFAGNGRPFVVAFNSFSSLKDGTEFQIRNLLSGWPGVQNSTTLDQFIASTEPIKANDPKGRPRRAGYFGAHSEEYKRSMEPHFNAYFELFPDPLGTSTDDGGEPFYVMSNNTVDAESNPENDPVGDRLGRNIRFADEERQRVAAAQTAELRRQIDILRAMPPLVLLINPSEFTRKYESSHDDSNKGRRGSIIHKWLERPMVISSSGVTAGQYVVTADGAGGLAPTLRTSSLSYMNLMSLVGIYRNNGVLFGGGDSDRGIPIVNCSVYIYYDQHVYIGSFDDFSVQDSADKPHNMSYSFGFTTRYDLDMSDQNFVLDALVSQV